MTYLSEIEQQAADRYAHVPLPSDATDSDPWRSRGDGEWRRLFVTQEWHIAGVWVSVAGEQSHHGRVTRWLHVGGDHKCSTSERNRLITALEEAGTLIDGLNAT